jgi:asparagine synthase (glutamine-hydrolysing)
MCGIAGLLSPHGVGEGALAAMNACLVHRGPDDHGLWLAPDPEHPGGPATVGLAHRRLSIVDLSPLGRNPMSRDGRLCITYNGEVYNFQALRTELEALGERFHSQSDTEVILAAYDRWGTACLGSSGCSRSHCGTRQGDGSFSRGTASGRSLSTTRDTLAASRSLRS